MISNALKKTIGKSNLYVAQYNFSTVQKKTRMELTLRTPYKTILRDFSDFTRILAKSNEAALVIQNKAPPALYVLPPGHLRIKLNSDQESTSGDILHLGGWVTVHLDNSCEIQLIDCFERKDVKPDQFANSEIGRELDTVSGRYMNKLRRNAARIFARKAAN
mmetsp:Transcript_18308/g.15952  ORF Transcript_18308/g.15952 Transcript_18308/m.15952 type:complete len:162 (+) Transcript_18308:77-562(+)